MDMKIEQQEEMDDDNSKESFVREKKPKLNNQNLCETDKLDCGICGKTFGLKATLNRHIQSVHERAKPHKCDICETYFTRKGSLNDHILHVHDKVKPHKCKLCGMCFAQKSKLNNHVRSVHEKAKPYKCELCEKCFSGKDNLNSHIRSVHEEAKPYKCDVCEKCFSLRSYLNAHIRSVHEKAKPYQCEACQKWFPQRHYLNMHIQAVHEHLKPYKCDICSKDFAQKSGLNNHIQSVHDVVKQHKCYSTCGKYFSRKAQLTTHIRFVHEKVKPHKCEFCEKWFSQKSQLSLHIQAVHEKTKPYQCKTCKKCFARKGYLKYHIGLVHEKPKVKPPNHKCEVCEKYANYVYAKNNPTNQRQNSLITPEQNTLKQVKNTPDKDCKNFANLAEHDEAKPYQCETCRKCFACKYALNFHIQIVHRSLPSKLSKPHDHKCDVTPDEDCKNFASLAEHDEAKPHQCETCRKRFACQYALNFHIQIVHQSLPSKLSKPHDHKCDVCEKYENYIRVRSKSDRHQQNLIVSEQNVMEQVQDPLAVTDANSKNLTINSESLDINHALQSGSCNDAVKVEPSDIPDEEAFTSGIGIEHDDLEIKHEPLD